MRRLTIVGLLVIAALPPVARAADPTGFQAYKGVRVSGENPKDEPQSTAVEYTGSPLALRYSYIGRDAAEPMVAVDREGVAFFSAGAFDAAVGGLARQELRRSRDGGISWEPLQVPFFSGQGETTTLDPYVTSDHLTGRVFAVTLLGGGSYLAYTDDSGETFQESAMGSPGVNDHQSLSTAPPPEGIPGAATSDVFPNLVYYCVNQVSDARCLRSADGGATFTPTGGPAFLQSGEGAEGQDPGLCSALHGHLVGDSKGRVFIPAGHCGVPTVAISEDAGLTWQQKVISTKIRSADVHEAMGVDKNDNLYYTWMDPKHEMAYLATSTDHGQSWSEPLMYSPPGIHEVNFPTMVAGDPGRIAITFPATPTDVKEDENGNAVDPAQASGRPWFTYVVMSTNALDPNPTFLSNTANPANDPVHRGNCGPGRCGNMFDFMEATFSPKDGAVWASATDTCTDSNDCNIDPEIGPNDAEGVAVKQINGPKIIGEGFFGAPGAAPPLPAGPPAPAQPKKQLAPSAKRVRITCTRARDKKAPSRCRIRLPGAPGGTTVSVRLFKKKVLLAGGAVKLNKGKGVIRLKGRKGLRLPIAKYNVLVTVSRPGAISTRREKTLRLKNR